MDPYRQIFERNPRPMWVYDVETLAIVAANDAAVAQYGYSVAEFTRLTIRDLRTPADRQRLDEFLAGSRAGLTNAGTWRHCRKDGTPLDVEIMSHDVEWAGRPARVVTAYDATERLRRRLEVESALAALAARFMAGADAELSAVLGMLGTVLGARCAYLLVADAEGAALRSAGVWPASASGSAPGSAARWPDPNILADWLRVERGQDGFVVRDVATRGGGDSAVTADVRALLGAHGVGSVLVVPVRCEDGALLGAVGFDHTQPGHAWSDEDVRALRLAGRIIAKELDRRRASDALRASEARLRLIFSQLPAVLWTTDAALRVTALQGAHAAAVLDPARRTAVELPELLGATGEAEAVLDAHRRALAGDATATEWRTASAWLQAHIEPLADEGGNVVGTIGIALDVTERRALEAQLRHSQRMESVGRLAGGVAHDFNNILTAITGHASFLLDALPKDDARHEDAAGIRRAAERAAALTRQLLVFARQQVVQPAVISLGAALEEMHGMLRPLLGESYMLRTDVPPDLGTVLADRGQIEQVITNLVLNARDAMPDGGTIDVRMSDADVAEDDAQRPAYVEPGAYVRLTVSDRGVGMDAATQAHAFEPFFTTKATGHGSGLGLSTVYATIKGFGGYVWVHSQPGSGTTVELLLPRSAAATASDAAAAAGAASSSPAPASAQRAGAAPDRRGDATIVLVEDEDSVRSIVRRLLESHGYRVLAAASGEEALALCAAFDGTIDLLVTDVVMPGIGGREVADRLAASRPGTRTLFMSGYTTDEIIRRGIVTEAIAFIEKPFAPAQLIERIHTLLQESAS